MQAQHSPPQPSYTSSSCTQSSREDQLTTTESQQNPAQGSPIYSSHAHSPHSPTRVQSGPAQPQQSPPPHSPVQDYTSQTQLDRPCSTNIITQPQHSPTPRSPAQVGTSHPQSPTQDSKPTLDQGSPGSSSPAQLQCWAAQDISTLDQDLSLVYCRSTQTARRHASLRPISAPCSPSPAPPKATQCSLSQPTSPVKAYSLQPVRPSQLSLLPSQLATQSEVTEECIRTPELKSLEQLSPNLDGQTLESSPTAILSTMPPDSHGTDGNQLGPVQSSTLSPDHSSPLQVPALPTPESLVHISSSVEHSSLIFSPCADRTEEHLHRSPSCDSPSRCGEANEGKASPVHIQNSSASSSPKHASQMPASPASSPLARASPVAVETSPVHVSYTVKPSMQPASPIHPITCQDEEVEVSVDHLLQSEPSPSHPNSTLGSPVHTETNSEYSLMERGGRASPSVCSFAKLTQTGQSSPTHVQTTSSPSQASPVQTSPLPPSFSPSHCRPTDTSSAGTSVSHSLSHSGQTTSYPASVTDVSVIHSPPRSSPAGQASPVHIQSTCSSAHSGPAQRQTPSLANTTHSSPAHAAVAGVSPPHSPAQASETYRSPQYSPAPDTGTSSGPAVASSSLDVVASSVIQSSVLPVVVQLLSTDSIRQTSPTPASSSAVSPNQAPLSPVSRSPAGPPQTPDRSAENQQSPASGSPVYHSSQDNTVMPSTSPPPSAPPPPAPPPP
ncbi:DNA-directed RNA polymerase II subunit RPB1-like, partial [Morone saxatilis]|uniref:DNA-directed RNA polymerase II subunit RPB1-like n=1 Tax=Morone saxatilis TaxID=34816 RepID=UPI0015E20364